MKQDLLFNQGIENVSGESSGSSILRQPRHIILTDDDDDDREFFRLAVKQGFPQIKLELIEAGDYLLNRLLTNGPLPDLIFLDINMPRIDGIECLKSIRANQTLKSIPVIMYSTSAVSPSIDHAYQAGADGYVIKPEGIVELKSILTKILSDKWGAHQQPDRKDFVVNVKAQR